MSIVLEPPICGECRGRQRPCPAAYEIHVTAVGGAYTLAVCARHLGPLVARCAHGRDPQTERVAVAAMPVVATP